MRAGALYYALFVSLIILIVLNVLIVASYYHKLSLTRLWDDIYLNDNIESATVMALAHGPEMFKNKNIDLFGKGIDSVKIDYSEWGAYGLLKIRADKPGMSRTRVFLSGKSFEQNFSIIRRNESVLNLSGEVNLTGQVNFKPELIQERVLEGLFPNVSTDLKFVKADIGAFLPDTAFIERSLFRLSGAVIPNYLSLSSFQKDPARCSFLDSTIMLYEAGDVFLGERDLSGNIAVVSDATIYVGKDTKLKDVCLYAENIVVQDGFKGTAQFFASHSLTIGEDCILGYPSLLAVINSVKENETMLLVGKRSKVFGALLLKNDVGIIENYGYVKGLIFSEAFVEQKGNVDGTIICDDFIFRSNAGVFKSHIINAAINEMDEELLWPVVFGKSGKQQVIDWVN